MQNDQSRGAKRHDAAQQLSDCQAGVVARRQLLTVGWNPTMIKAQLASRRWARLLPGIYTMFTGEPSSRAWYWAAVLYAGDESWVTGWSALDAHGVKESELPVWVGVPAHRTVARQDGLVEVRRVRTPPPVRERNGLPPIQAVEYALLEVSSDLSELATSDLICGATQRRRADPAKLERALRSMSRVRHRSFITSLLSEILTGATTLIEIDVVRDILRAHGLPEGEAQALEYQNGAQVFRDREIKPYGLVLEIDGRLGHAEATGRFRDFERDNSVTLSGRSTIRIGYHDVKNRPCSIARQIEVVLHSLGWNGLASTCGDACEVHRSVA